MSRTWVALLPRAPADADLAVPAMSGSGPPVTLVAWTTWHRPHPQAAVTDPRMVGPGGPVLRASWIALPPGQRPLFDAPEVVAVRRRLLGSWPALGLSTLVVDGQHLAGAVLLSAVGAPLPEHPFGWLAPARHVLSEGFFLPLAAPTGPSLERYGGQPWPFDRFAAG